MLLLLLAILIVTYFLYTRFIKVYMRIYYYHKQYVPFSLGACLPFVGSFKAMVDHEKEFKPDNHPLLAWNKATYFPDETRAKAPAFSGVLFGNKLCLIVNRPEVLEELLVTKNKFYDKHPSSASIL